MAVDEYIDDVKVVVWAREKVWNIVVEVASTLGGLIGVSNISGVYGDRRKIEEIRSKVFETLIDENIR